MKRVLGGWGGYIPSYIFQHLILQWLNYILVIYHKSRVIMVEVGLIFRYNTHAKKWKHQSNTVYIYLEFSLSYFLVQDIYLGRRLSYNPSGRVSIEISNNTSSTMLIKVWCWFTCIFQRGSTSRRIVEHMKLRWCLFSPRTTQNYHPWRHNKKTHAHWIIIRGVCVEILVV